MKTKFSLHQISRQKAFTLIELLCVISVVVLLTAVTIPAMQNSRATLVLTSASHLSGLMGAWRETAIVTRLPVAVVMLPADKDSIQRFTTLQFVPATPNTSASWKQMSKWEALPSGVLADKGIDDSGNQINAFMLSSSTESHSPQLSSALPDLVYAGKTYQPNSGYGYIVFLPDGSLYQDSDGAPSIPCILRIVEGVSSGVGGISAYTGAKSSTGKPINYCDIVLNAATGQVKLVRP